MKSEKLGQLCQISDKCYITQLCILNLSTGEDFFIFGTNHTEFVDRFQHKVPAYYNFFYVCSVSRPSRLNVHYPAFVHYPGF